ncbi:MAG: preprotein translocase subunit SecB [Aliidongia sp.]|jgi:preprotein translocase subunit SecB|nr:preprotein translocase subunit SecB [Aliidongia sp.]
MSEPAANGQDGAAAQGPVLIINAQYVRDLSFENPRAPESLMGQSAPPEVGVEIDVKARQISPELFEVVLSFQVQARTGDDVAFLIELDYGAVLTIRNAAPEMIAALLLVEAPRILFPFARAIISNATRDGGFPPLLLNPVDFADLQRRKAQQAQQASDTAQA